MAIINGLLIGVAGCAFAYAVAYSACTAYFQCKYDYHRKLMESMKGVTE